MAAMRLRRVRFKDGRTLEVLRPKDEGIARKLTACAARASEYGGADMAGFAIVAWRRDGCVFVNYENGDCSPVPGGGVPQYAHDVLLAELGARWAKQ